MDGDELIDLDGDADRLAEEEGLDWLAEGDAERFADDEEDLDWLVEGDAEDPLDWLVEGDAADPRDWLFEAVVEGRVDAEDLLLL